MKIGIDCFFDTQFASMIESNNRHGDCDITHKEDCFIYDTELDSYLADYLEEIIDVFSLVKYLKVSENDSRVGYLSEFLFRWRIFAVNPDKIHNILINICSERYKQNPEIFNEKVSVREFFSVEIMNQICILKTKTWDDFCEDIKHINRFHSDYINFPQLKNLLKNMIEDYPANSLRLYRARICDEKTYDKGHDIDDMGAPGKEIATAGRSNSEGIPVLYLADQPLTTFHEIRAREKDRVTVGTFIQQKDLKLVDFSLFDKIGPFSIPDFDMLWFTINIDIIRKISDEIAKPMRRFDKKIDYVPTQYICEYIKSLGYSGIKYKSTVFPGGVNYAFFDTAAFSCKSTEVVQIENITYDWNSV